MKIEFEDQTIMITPGTERTWSDLLGEYLKTLTCAGFNINPEKLKEFADDYPDVNY